MGLMHDDEGKKHRHGYTIHFEQDAFAFGGDKNEDRDYTQGTFFEWFGTRLDETPFFNKPLDYIDKLYRLDLRSDREISDSITLGIKAYTPDDIGLKAPIEDDRPYASYVFVTDSKTREFCGSTPWHRSYWRTAFTIGTLGNSIAEKFQTMVHQINDVPDDKIPRGWDNQIDEPLVFNYQFARLDNRWVEIPNAPNIDFGTLWGANLGTIFVDAFVGISGRVGVFENQYVSLPGMDHTKTMEFAQPSALPKKQDSGNGRSPRKCRIFTFKMYECFLYGSLTLKAVAMNRLLEGYSGDPVRIPREKLEPLVGLGSWGVTLKFTRHSTLTIAQYVRSSEFESDRDDSDRNHYYGGIYFAVFNDF